VILKESGFFAEPRERFLRFLKDEYPLPMGDPGWSIWVDTGGTFTDGVAVDPDGSLRRVKILSTSALRGTVQSCPSPGCLEIAESWSAPPGLLRGLRFGLLDREHGERRVERYDPLRRLIELCAPLDPPPAAGAAFELLSDEEAPLLAARLLTGTPSGKPLPPSRMRLGTTLGTNALLERRGVSVALFITRGFGDLLLIGTQQRPDLFRLDVQKPEPLYDAVVEVDERLGATGEVLRPLDVDSLRPQAASLLERGIRVAAVALMHSYLTRDHERLLRDRLLEWGFGHVSCSHELAPRIKLLARARTSVVDAYLAPVVRTYLERIAASLPSGGLLVMTSAGGLLDPASFRPKDSLLSGPAGGVVGAAGAGRRSGLARLISFDMGGTSTDVARFDGDYEYRYEHRVGEAELAAPALAIETVAAGGGSICWLDGERLRVGPQSAGARPGPACYGAGGPLTLTDVNLLLGRLDPRRFEIPIRAEPARGRLEELRCELASLTGEQPPPEELLQGLLAIADETMADAIRRISLRRGFDPAEHALVAFGGAGGQHACGIAARLDMRRIVVPADAALLSALGLGAAVVERFVERQVLEPLDRTVTRIPRLLDELAREASRAVEAAGVPRAEVEVRRRILHLRFVGQDATLAVEWKPGLPVAEAFRTSYRELFGHHPERRAVELESVRVVASSRGTRAGGDGSPSEPLRPEPCSRARTHFEGGWRETPAFDRDSLRPGSRIDGPALVLERHSATVIEPGWRAEVDHGGAVVLERRSRRASVEERQRPEAVRLELFTQRFYTLVKEMGERLERTAVSTNVKERLDFSCALLDPRGELIVNAPHIPVHLGALGLCVRTIREHLSLGPGDVVLTNHPAFGGSHLPDVTVVTPVFSWREALIGYVASRAHHAEIGGIRPGSMPPAATRLAEEGVVLPPVLLVRGGRTQWKSIRRRLESAPHPTRAIEDNLADLRAAVAANHAGAEALRKLARVHGDETLLQYMSRLEALAARRIGEALARIPDGDYEAIEPLDDGSPIRARIEIRGARARIDFGGTADRHPGNLNATPAIVQSAVLYVLRLLLREPLPLNEGLLRAVTIDLPRGLLNPEFPEDPLLAPAVVGGNVETSQRLVDTLLKALRLAACSQGTMNNLLFGGPGYGYYETLGGGCGAGPGYHGASAVHSHMTNTRITDPEVLEHRYPVRVERFAVRHGSGGAGRFRGGDGLVREIRFLQPASVSVLSQHRRVAPYGLEGGRPGACGGQRLLRRDGTVLELEAIDACEAEPGDRLVVETPGGGGYGTP
jgi:5-oxoprolinase (ATP-hydrolysing)